MEDKPNVEDRTLLDTNVFESRIEGFEGRDKLTFLPKHISDTEAGKHPREIRITSHLGI